MKLLCRFCEKEFEGDGQTLSREAMSHILECHPKQAEEMQNRMFNMMKDYYLIG